MVFERVGFADWVPYQDTPAKIGALAQKHGVVSTGAIPNAISAVPPSSLTVPATLHASLLGRLDRLGPSAKNVAQVGAAIGRDFSHELLAAAVPLAEPELQEALRRLVEAGLVFQRGMPPASPRTARAGWSAPRAGTKPKRCPTAR
jgi:hypothetical protein